MHKIEKAIQVFLESLDTLDASSLDKQVEEFGEDCKKALRKCLLAKRKEEPFSIRMSNIGKPLRQLMLEKSMGSVQGPIDPQHRLRMTYGYIWESFIFFLLKASGVSLELNGKVELPIKYTENDSYTVYGTYDCKIDGEIFDVKSASSWSYDNKFTSLETMEKDDPFGYVGQAVGYSLADKSYFGGWIVCDKSDGRIKVVTVPKEGYKELARKYLDDFKHKIKELLNPEAVIPPCPGVVEEYFNKKPTGNKILSTSCGFCNYKYSCHKNLQYKECQVSSAKNKPWKFYVELNKPNE